MNQYYMEIYHNNFKTTILKQGAQIISFESKSSKEILWHTDMSHYQKGKPFRGGIPICWPWFGKAQNPPHGFARIVEWELQDREDTDEYVVLRWRLVDSEQTRAIWNHKFDLTLTMKLGDTIEMHLAIDTDVKTAGAFHTYLKVNDVVDVQIAGLGARYKDALLDGTVCVESDDMVEIRGEVDRVYTKTDVLTTMIENTKIIDMYHHNHSDIVLWNPYMDLADMERNEYKKMVCIETARINRPFEIKDFMGLKINF